MVLQLQGPKIQYIRELPDDRCRTASVDLLRLCSIPRSLTVTGPLAPLGLETFRTALYIVACETLRFFDTHPPGAHVLPRVLAETPLEQPKMDTSWPLNSALDEITAPLTEGFAPVGWHLAGSHAACLRAETDTPKHASLSDLSAHERLAIRQALAPVIPVACRIAARRGESAEEERLRWDALFGS